MPAEWLSLPVTDGEFRVLAAVCQYARLGSDDGCLRSYEKLAARVGMHRDSAKRAVRKLVALGVVEVENRGGPGTGLRSTTNAIRPVWELDLDAVEAAAERLTSESTRGDRTAPPAKGDSPAPLGGDRTAPPSTLKHPVLKPVGICMAADRLAVAMGSHATAWHTLALAYPAPASREGLAQSLLMALEGGGTVSQPITPADLASGILTALTQADRPSDRLILGCAVNASRRPAVGTGPERRDAERRATEAAPLPSLV